MEISQLPEDEAANTKKINILCPLGFAALKIKQVAPPPKNIYFSGDFKGPFSYQILFNEKCFFFQFETLF